MTKSGFVSIIGRPNVGKSTLLNHIINEKIAIVTNKAQTTRNNIKGIYQSKDAQIVFIDTPGIHKPHQRLGEEMNSMAIGSLSDADVVVLVIDASQNFGQGDEFLINNLNLKDKPLILVFNKIDEARIDHCEKLKEKYKAFFPKSNSVDVVAKEGFNVDLLIQNIIDLLPIGPFYYETDTITDIDEVFRIKEIIREKALLCLSQEVPHSLAVYMENIEWEANPIQIDATIYVEKESQKGIVIGANGRKIKEIGIKARQPIEALLHKHVCLNLFVKVSNDWRENIDLLETFGYKNKK